MEICLHHLIGEVPGVVPEAVVKDDEQFHALCQANCEKMLHRIYQELPRETTDEGVLGILAPIHEAKYRLPRMMPIPVVKPKTKWEKFAKEKGIRKASGRNRLIFDDVEKDWKLRYGGRSLKKAEEKRDFIIEHKKGDDYMADPFEAKAIEKSLSKSKQQMKEIKNKVAAAGFRMPRKDSAKKKPKKLGRKAQAAALV